MFDRIEIERFRGIRYASLSGFKQINLFFGKNNCGKSSLLEAMFLASGMSNPVLPIQMNMVRGYNKARSVDLELDFYNLDSAQPIHICWGNDETRDLRISLLMQDQDKVSIQEGKSDVLSNVDKKNYDLKFDFQINGQSFISKLHFDSVNPDKAVQKIAKGYVESLRCLYLSPKFDFHASIQGLKRILQNKDEQFIIDGLMSIEPCVKDFVFTDGDMLVDIGLAKRIPVNMMGDGARKMVSLLTAVYDCKDGVLLVDEISNGFHYSVMHDLWNVLIKAAIRNNTQLFITTHDIDSIKGLRNAAINGFDDSVAAFKLLKTPEDELKAYHYSLESLDYSINQEIEVR